MATPLWNLLLIQAGLMLGSVGVSAMLARLARNRSLIERMVIPAMPILITMLAWHWFVAIAILSHGGPWSAIRLAPSMSLRYGYKLYEAPGLGPVLGWIYPPIAPLAYLPVTFISEPVVAVIAGRCLTLVFYYAPAAWLILTSGAKAGPRGWWSRLSLFLTFALLTSQSQALSYCSTEIHADAAALGLAAVSLGLLGRSRSRSAWGPHVGAVAFGALAVWAKQLIAPLFVALPVWIFVRDGFKPALRFTALWFVIGRAFALFVLFLFSFDGLFYNIVTIPSRHPWTATRPRAIWSAFVYMQSEHTLLLALIAGGLIVWLGCRTVPSDPTDGATRREAWPLFLFVGLLESPLAVLGLIKVGGYDNNLSYCLYFLALGGVLLLAVLMNRECLECGERKLPPLHLMIVGMNLLLALVGSERIALELAGGLYPGRDPADAVRYLREHPGDAYFPWHPLEHLMIEGKATHSEYGVWDRKLAGDPMTVEHFLKFVPLGARRICYPDGITGAEQITLKYAGGSWRRRELAELPGWTCFERYDGSPVFSAANATSK